MPSVRSWLPVLTSRPSAGGFNTTLWPQCHLLTSTLHLRPVESARNLYLLLEVLQQDSLAGLLQHIQQQSETPHSCYEVVAGSLSIMEQAV